MRRNPNWHSRPVAGLCGVRGGVVRIRQVRSGRGRRPRALCERDLDRSLRYAIENISRGAARCGAAGVVGPRPPGPCRTRCKVALRYTRL